jgi:alanine racemase
VHGLREQRKDPGLSTSRLEVDLAAVERNLGVVRSVVGPAASVGGAGAGGGVGVCAVLKQDAYGAGAVRVGKRLVAAGAEMLAVYSLDEARALADHVAGVPILVLMPVSGVDRSDPLYRHASAGRLHLTLHNADQLAGVAEMASRLGAVMPVHVQVDTGLSRGGVRAEEAVRLLERTINTARVRLSGLMTHFASPCCDGAFTDEQAARFASAVDSARPLLRAAAAAGPDVLGGVGLGPGRTELALHAANSCAAFRSRRYHLSLVRVGQSLLGYALDETPKAREPESPTTKTARGGKRLAELLAQRSDAPDFDAQTFEFARQAGQLEPAVRWISTVVHTEEIPAGWPVGYGSTWRAPTLPGKKPTKIAIIPVGYADGYPRSLGGSSWGGPGVVGFTGRAYERRGAGDEGQPSLPTVYAPVVGRVSMDQITVDVTDVPEAYLRPRLSLPVGYAGTDPIGPEVELYSRRRGSPNYLPRLAAAAGSITHELLCRIGPRVERVYKYPAHAHGEGGSVVVGAISPGGPLAQAR